MTAHLVCPSCQHVVTRDESGTAPPRCPACDTALNHAPAEPDTRSVAAVAGPRTDLYLGKDATVGTVPSAPLPPIDVPAPKVGTLVGQTVAGYEVLEELGRGGMGVVYKARQVGLNRIVALKMILSASLAGDEERARFRTEALSAGRLQHPNIVTVHEIGEWTGGPYFSLEYVAGGSLAQALGANPQTPRESAALVEVLARAMDYAHSRGVIHRDLKPQNVLIPARDGAAAGGKDTRKPSGEGTKEHSKGSRPSAPTHSSAPSADGTTLAGWLQAVKITDFGLAKQLEEEGPGQTQTGQVMGTPSYMAPEQAAGRVHEIGPAADIYSLGAILYHCLTGRPPFKGANSRETIEQVLHAEPVRPGRLVPRLPPDLDTIALKCLEKESGRRYASARELADDLRRFLDGDPIKARPVGPAGRMVKWARRYPALAGLTALVVALVVFGTSAVLSQWLRAEGAAALAREEADNAGREKRAAVEARGKADDASRLAERRRELAEKETDRANRAAAEAKRQEVLAIAAAALAKKESARAERAAINAIDAQKAEVEQRKLAETRRALAETAEAQARRAFTTSRVAQAQAAWRDGNRKLAADLLDGCATEARFWDWHVMRRLTDGGPVSLPGVGGVFAFSPDGRHVAGRNGGDLVLIDLGEQAKTRRLEGHTDAVTDLVFAPDSKALLSASRDGTVRLWSLEGKEVGRFQGHAGPVLAVAISPDGKRAASAGDKVRVWTVATLREEKALGEAFTATRALTFSPDGALLAWGGESTPAAGGALGGLRVWEAATGKELVAVSEFHRWGVANLAFHPEGGRLAVSSTFSTKVIDPRTGKDAGPKLDGDRLGSVVVSPDGRWWAARGNTAIHLIDAATGKEDRSIPVPTVTSYRIGFTPDGRFLALSRQFEDGEDDRIDFWPTRGPMEGLQLRHGDHSPFRLAFSPDSRRLITSGTGTAVIWDTQSASPLRTLPGAQGAVAWSGDGRYIASGGDERFGAKSAGVTIWDAETGRSVRTPEGGKGPNYALAFSADSKYLAAGGGSLREGRLTVWEVATGKRRWSITTGNDSVGRLAWAPEGTFLATAGMIDRFLHYWDAASGKLIQRLEAHAGGIGGLAYSPDKRWLATAGSPQAFSRVGEIKIYDRKLGREVRVLRGHNQVVWGLDWGDGGQRLASGALDDTIKLWDPANGLDALTLRAPGLRLMNLAFSPDGRYLAACGLGSVYLFDGRPTVERAVIKRQPRSSTWTATGADGRWVLSKDELGSLVARDPKAGRVLWSLEVKGRVEPPTAVHVDTGRVAQAVGKEVVERDAVTGKVTRTFAGHDGVVWLVAYSTDGKSLAAASGGITATLKPAAVRVIVWDAASGKERHRFSGPDALGDGLGVVISPNLTRLGILVRAAAERNKVKVPGYRVWDLATGKERAVALDFDAAQAVAWRPEGRRASPARLGRGALRGSDETVRVMDVPADEAAKAAARLLPQPYWHKAEVASAMFGRRWFQVVHHLDRARAGIETERDPAADDQLAAALHNLGKELRDQGQYALGMTAIRRAVPIYERLVRDHPKEHRYRRDYANTITFLGHIEEMEGRLTQAEKSIRRGVKEFEAAAAADPTFPGYRSDVVYARRSLADILKMAKRYNEAEKEYISAVEVGRKLLEDHPGQGDAIYNLSAACHNLADLYSDREETDKAIESFREAKTLLEQVARPLAVSHVHRDLCNTLMALGQALRKEGKYDEGLASVEAAIKRMRQMADRPGALPTVRSDCAEMVGRYANFLDRGPKPLDAEEVYEEAIRRSRDLLREVPDQVWTRFHLSAILHNYGNHLSHTAKRLFAAEHSYRQAEAMLKKIVDEAPEQPMYRRDLANTRLYLGRALASLGKRLPAQSMLRQAEKDWAALAEKYKEAPEYVLNAAHARAELALVRGRAEAAAKEAEAMVKAKAKDARDPYTAASVLARCADLTAKDKALEDAKRQAAVEQYASRAVELLAEALREKKARPDRARKDADFDALRARADYKKLLPEQKK